MGPCRGAAVGSLKWLPILRLKLHSLSSCCIDFDSPMKSFESNLLKTKGSQPYPWSRDSAKAWHFEDFL